MCVIGQHDCDLSIIIVSYNTRETTLECLRSIYRQTSGPKFEIIVVDNNSRDGSADAIRKEFGGVRLFRAKENLGFARANNFAATHAAGRYLLLLNPDTLVLNAAIQKLWSFAEGHPAAAIFGGRTVFRDGSLNPTSCWGKPTPWSVWCRAIGLAAAFRGTRLFDPESLGSWDRDSVRRVDIVTGCLLLIREEVWRMLGGFDDRFFMYAEEADLCLRADKLGYEALICPDACIVHYDGGSESVRADTIVRLFRAKAQLFMKHWGPLSRRFGIEMLDLWAITRLIAFGIGQIIQPKVVESFKTWRDIWSRRDEWQNAAKHFEIV